MITLQPLGIGGELWKNSMILPAADAMPGAVISTYFVTQKLFSALHANKAFNNLTIGAGAGQQ